jgi:fermentation-respiration switch protein FrsA (DUF1100 family)
MIFLPRPPSSYADTPDILKLQTEDGVTISALHLPNPDARFTILYSHGVAEDLGQLRPFFETYRDQGFAIFAYDYHGYGTSDGRPSEKNVYRDATAALRYLVDQAHVKPEHIIAHGRSVGAGAACYLAQTEPIGGLILESAFVSAFRAVTRVRLAPFDKFENLQRLSRVRCPLLVIHGLNDDVIAPWHGKRLFAAATTPKANLWVEDATHDDIPLVAGPKYWEAISDLADRIENRASVQR